METKLRELYARAVNTCNGLDEVEEIGENVFFVGFNDEEHNHVCGMWVKLDCTKVLLVKFRHKCPAQSQLDAMARAAWFLRDMEDMRQRVARFYSVNHR